MTALAEQTAYRVADSIIEIPLADMLPDPEQARDEGADDELAASIAANGFYRSKAIELRVNPLAEARSEPPYIIVDGERRYRAAVKAGLVVAPAIVNDEAMQLGDRLLRQVVSNDGKRLKPMEEARTFKRIMDDKGWNIQQLATHLGKAKSTVSDRLAILDAPAVFQPLFARGVLTAAAAPLLRAYKDVPERILKEFVANVSRDDWHDFVETGSAVPLNDVEHQLSQIKWNQLRRLDASVAKHYDGDTCVIGKEKFAVDVAAYEKARQESYKDSSATSAGDEKWREEAAEQRRKEAAAAKKRLATRRAQFSAIAAKLPMSIGGSVNQSDAWSELLVDLLLKEVTFDTTRALAAHLKLESKDHGAAIRKHAKSLRAGDRVKLALQLLIAPDLCVSPYFTGGGDRLARVAKLLKIDLGKVKPDVEVKPAKTKAAKKGAKR